jgi:imidazolonepropionase-like amidohydrolase
MASGSLLLDNGLLINGTGTAPLREASVLIDAHGVISWAGASADIPPASEQARRIDVRGAALLPGFIDTHVHVTAPGGGGINPLNEATLPSSYLTLRAAANLRVTLDAGVTTIRDLGGADTGIKQAVAEGIVAGPRMLTAIAMISCTGGHGDSTFASGLTLNGLHRVSAVGDGEAECRRTARTLLRAGADWLKVAATGGVWSPTDQPDDEGLDEAEIAAIVNVARAHGGKKVAAHAQGRDGIANAVRAGVASIEHGYQIDQRTVEDMIDRGTYLVPTLTTATREPDRDKTRLVNYEKKMRWIGIARENIPLAIGAGVKVALGTDCGVADHGANLTELDRLIEFGMTPMQAIQAGTKNAADLLDMADQIGTIEPGKIADIVVADGDPLTDIKALTDPQHVIMVIQSGQVRKDLWGLSDLAT